MNKWFRKAWDYYAKNEERFLLLRKRMGRVLKTSRDVLSVVLVMTTLSTYLRTQKITLMTLILTLNHVMEMM